MKRARWALMIGMLAMTLAFGPQSVAASPPDYTLQKVGEYINTGYPWYQDAVIQNETAYLVNPGEIHLIDVSDPSSPGLLGMYRNTHGSLATVAVSGSYAVAGGEITLQVIDVSTPAAPVCIGRLEGPWFFRGVALSDGYAYAVDVARGYLRIFNVAIPTNPTLVASLYVAQLLNDIVVQGSYAYIAAEGSGLHIIDISNPEHPVRTAFLPLGFGTYDLSVVDRYAYVAQHTDGVLHIVDVADVYNPVVVGQLDLLDSAVLGAATSDGFAFVANCGAGLHAVDVSDPTTPLEVASVPPPGCVGCVCNFDVVAIGDLAYVIAREQGLSIYRLTPTNQRPFAEAGGPYSVTEGGCIALDGSESYDADPDDVISYEWDMDYDGSSFAVDATGSAPAFCAQYLDGPIAKTVALRVVDRFGATSAIDTAEVSIQNAPPEIEAITLAVGSVVAVGTCVDTMARFTDPGVLDTHVATWDWGDGTLSDGLVQSAEGVRMVAGTHAYSTAGVYTISLVVTDDDGGADTAMFEYVVVFDPTGGFVTGGGWINSPIGAYTGDTSLVGRATFGFVSRYKKGSLVPTGETQFQFRAGDLTFRSQSYDWLVIAGAKAMYKGTGMINGADRYGFLLSAVDSELTPSTSVDLFRIKIWDKDTGLVVYDNVMGASDDDLPTAIGGGSIQIHR